MTADHRLRLIRIKIERAYQHIRELESMPMPDTLHAYSVRIDHNAKLQAYPVQGIPINAAAAAGDAVHNLRSALDHLAYQLVIVGLNHGEVRKEPAYKIQFPISHSPDSYPSEKRRKIEGIQRPAEDAIDALKPYKTGNDGLWTLHQLDIFDKHRDFLSVGVARLIYFPDGAAMLHNEEAIFDTINAVDPDKYVEFSRFESIGASQRFGSRALLPTLHKLAELVCNIVTSFHPFLS
jgi:hypothetical protein